MVDSRSRPTTPGKQNNDNCKRKVVGGLLDHHSTTSCFVIHGICNLRSRRKEEKAVIELVPAVTSSYAGMYWCFDNKAAQ
jgi:hypothetical protein